MIVKNAREPIGGGGVIGKNAIKRTVTHSKTHLKNDSRRTLFTVKFGINAESQERERDSLQTHHTNKRVRERALSLSHICVYTKRRERLLSFLRAFLVRFWCVFCVFGRRIKATAIEKEVAF